MITGCELDYSQSQSTFGIYSIFLLKLLEFENLDFSENVCLSMRVPLKCPYRIFFIVYLLSVNVLM